jgi:hypothetical protein
MKKFLPLYKSALFSYLIDPLFYVSSLLTILFCAFRFFFGSKFFVNKEDKYRRRESGNKRKMKRENE